MDVDAVQQWSGNALLVFGDGPFRTGAWFVGISMPPARARDAHNLRFSVIYRLDDEIFQIFGVSPGG